MSENTVLENSVVPRPATSQRPILPVASYQHRTVSRFATQAHPSHQQPDIEGFSINYSLQSATDVWNEYQAFEQYCQAKRQAKQVIQLKECTRKQLNNRKRVVEEVELLAKNELIAGLDHDGALSNALRDLDQLVEAKKLTKLLPSNMPQKPSANQSNTNTSKTPMTQAASSRIQSHADRNPTSPSNTDGFYQRAQSAAARNQNAGDKK
ncbi:hypothetical protein BGZ49_006308 [Haplosporangium sp. Z 27]|nr:hypothetical protein BGZ49_006308 [Haplosporangium sp. Z 27]